MRLVLFVVGIALIMALSGCEVSKPYVMQVERTDQFIEGNRGYLQGTPPPSEDKTGRKRDFLAIDVDLPETPINLNANRTQAEEYKEDAAQPEQTPAVVQKQVVSAPVAKVVRGDDDIK